MSEVSNNTTLDYPYDFKECAQYKGWSNDRLAQEVIRMLPESMLNTDMTLKQLVISGWELYKNYIV